MDLSDVLIIAVARIRLSLYDNPVFGLWHCVNPKGMPWVCLVFRSNRVDKNFVYVEHGARMRRFTAVMDNGETHDFAIEEFKGANVYLASLPKTETGLRELMVKYPVFSKTYKAFPPNIVREEFVSLGFEQDGTRMWLGLYKEVFENGRRVGGVEIDRHHYRVSLRDFSTRGAVPPLFECEPAEMVRESRGELKRELAEYVFHPLRVSRMMETYGEDWDEKV
jgi:hypothetical protein